MRFSGKLVLLGLAVFALGGCRYKGWESFMSATTPNLPASHPAGRVVSGDAYAYGGVGLANGGLKPQTNYGLGSDPNSTAPVNPKFDQPEKGSGQQPGEYPNVGAPGAGQENGPGLQPRPDQLPTEGEISHG